MEHDFYDKDFEVHQATKTGFYEVKKIEEKLE